MENKSTQALSKNEGDRVNDTLHLVTRKEEILVSHFIICLKIYD